MLTKYHLEGTKIVFEDRNNDMIYYIYNNGELLGFKYNGITYYYHKNRYNDIVGIFDSSFNEIVSYEYDSWGAITNIVDNSNINLGAINPFRYRSYYYDEETKLYYLNSRYYNPVWRRFINADELITGQGIIGCNIYVYCGNNPIYRIENGNWWLTIGSMFVSGAISAVGKWFENVSTGENAGKGVLAAGITGLLSGITVAPPIKLGIGVRAIFQFGLAVMETTINAYKYKYSAGEYVEELIVTSVINNVSEFAGIDVLDYNTPRPKGFKEMMKSNYISKVIINESVKQGVSTLSVSTQKNLTRNFNTPKVKETRKSYEKSVKKFLSSQVTSFLKGVFFKLYDDHENKVCVVRFS